ncbi:unnamed protein product [Caretta caretta]
MVVDAVPAWTPTPSLCKDMAAPGIDRQRLAVTGPPGGLRDCGPMANVDPSTATPPGPEAAADHMPGWPPFVAVLRWAGPGQPSPTAGTAGGAVAPSIVAGPMVPVGTVASGAAPGEGLLGGRSFGSTISLPLKTPKEGVGGTCIFGTIPGV